ncbi:MAG: TIGR03757 family integrating conjugative element protein [Gammaproteobacteria bacterium]|nr:TIGR03757 family integrating conjugative element protein [Gammaproteobacteria bacterium]
MLYLPISLRKLALATAIIMVTVNSVVWAGDQPLVELFTAFDIPIIPDHQVDRVQVYEIDGIKRFEEQLSRGLPSDADAARRQAIERVTHVYEGQKKQVQRSAVGLSKAVQYGIDRYPAVVFDGEAVVYGVTDLGEALHRYRQWQEAPAQ